MYAIRSESFYVVSVCLCRLSGLRTIWTATSTFTPCQVKRGGYLSAGCQKLYEPSCRLLHSAVTPVLYCIAKVKIFGLNIVPQCCYITFFLLKKDPRQCRLCRRVTDAEQKYQGNENVYSRQYERNEDWGIVWLRDRGGSVVVCE